MTVCCHELPTDWGLVGQSVVQIFETDLVAFRFDFCFSALRRLNLDFLLRGASVHARHLRQGRGHAEQEGCLTLERIFDIGSFFVDNLAHLGSHLLLVQVHGRFTFEGRSRVLPLLLSLGSARAPAVPLA